MGGDSAGGCSIEETGDMASFHGVVGGEDGGGESYELGDGLAGELELVGILH